ncbi:helix-turn-helix transcriptional regulator [Marinobacter salinisoli]|uniref:Helix-turn-helix transcriptional regulator n=1 Tax=Marinobacter salinisoli TaxID=2769486 RepID=A0ABX7MNR9_9GAMM|nr:helix-turn-helix transcriptional regulator [Marinobacter salinisoli]QSP93803.1 helix-turn-helix transcriptional regulator [Marinobacter salinisoli]
MSSNSDSTFWSPDYHDLIGLIYDAIGHPNGFFPFINRFIRVFDGKSACFAIYDLNAGSVAGVWPVNIPDDVLKFYADHVADQDALLEAALAVNEQGKLGFVASNLDLENVEFIRSQTRIGEFMDLLGARDAVCAVTFRDKNYLNFFVMQRSKHQSSFSPEELAAFNLILPHINRAVSLFTKLASLSNINPTPERMVLQDLKRGILICDASFRVVFRNAYARTIISENPAIKISDQGLLTLGPNSPSTSLMVALTSAVRASIERRETPDKIIALKNGSSSVTITVSPLQAPEGELATKNHKHRGGAIIGLYDWSIRPYIDPDVLKAAFSLTPSEAQIAAMLSNGLTISDIATQTYRTRETVKSHLRSVFRKTNTSRQAELVALLAASSEIA